MRLTHGFTQFLPTRSRLFFERQYIVDFVQPLQVGGASPFPREIEINKLVAPDNQALVIQRVGFFALAHNGIDVDGVRDVPRGESLGTLAFKFQMQNRSMLDFSTNLPASGLPLTYGQSQGQGGVGVPTQANQGQAAQGTGPAVPSQEANSYFASYAMPGQPIRSSAIVLRPPPFDLRFIGVQYGGWLADAKEMQSILDMLTK